MSEGRDTIVARATAPGAAGVGIVRLSGPRAAAVAAALAGALPPAATARLRTFRDAAGEAIDRGLVLHFPAPHSYTGEEVVELHGHGGPVVLELVRARCLELGARAARPGEFAERAFLNDRIDLAQAEATADLIEAGTAAAARAALRSLEGAFSRRVEALAAQLLRLRIELEAGIDFADEALGLAGEQGRAAELATLVADLASVIDAAEQGRRLHDGATVVIAGRPNAGKSSLLNALAGHDAAIVTDVPGTTRDVLRERIDLDGLGVTLLDTAGLRESTDAIEAEGVRRARRELARADHILYLVDGTAQAAIAALEADLAALPSGSAVTVVVNKADLEATSVHAGDRPVLAVSARRGDGLDALRAHLGHVLGGMPADGGVFSARQRHVDALRRAGGHLERAHQLEANGDGAELVAEELRLAHEALGEITGRVTSDDLLGKIFATFCIGK